MLKFRLTFTNNIFSEDTLPEPAHQAGWAVGIKTEPQSSSEAEDDDTLLLQFQVREEGGAAGIVFGSGTV